MSKTFDTPVTDKELDTFYGKPKTTRIADEMREILTKTIRIVPAKSLGLDLISYKGGKPKLSTCGVLNVIADYSSEIGPLAALAVVLEKSDCPLVAAYREALAVAYIDANEDEIICFLGEEA